jgi:hypothetical protein
MPPTPSVWKQCRNALLICVGVYVIAGVAHFGAEWLFVWPTPDMKTLSGYRGRFPDSSLVEIRKGGVLYHVAFGPQVMFNEHPAGYVFGPDGTLIGWSTEAGDAGPLAEFWSLARNRRLGTGRHGDSKVQAR